MKRRLRRFRAAGRPVRLGPKRGRTDLGRVDEYGPAQSVTLYIGQLKGELAHNTTGACARRASRFTDRDVDRAVLRARAEQVGREHVGATRVKGRGFFQGGQEPSLAYQIAYIPPEGGGPPRETSFAVFSRNMNRLAEQLAEEFCQDSVLVIRDDGTRRTAAGASWTPDE